VGEWRIHNDEPMIRMGSFISRLRAGTRQRDGRFAFSQDLRNPTSDWIRDDASAATDHREPGSSVGAISESPTVHESASDDSATPIPQVDSGGAQPSERPATDSVSARSEQSPPMAENVGPGSSLRDLELIVERAIASATAATLKSSPHVYLEASSPLETAWRALAEFESSAGPRPELESLRTSVRDSLAVLAGRCHAENEGRHLTGDPELLCPGAKP
jgi:hypothetical protein